MPKFHRVVCKLRWLYCIFIIAHARNGYISFRCKIWRHHRVPQPQFSIRRGAFNDSAVNKLYCTFFTAHAWNGYNSTSGLKSDVTYCRLSLPRFPLTHGNFGDWAVNKGYMAHFSLRMSKTDIFPFPDRFQPWSWLWRIIFWRRFDLLLKFFDLLWYMWITTTKTISGNLLAIGFAATMQHLSNYFDLLLFVTKSFF